jgi:hypothetical protein
MICWVCRAPITEDQATAAATGLPRSLRANEGSRTHLRCHGEWREAQSPASTPSRVRDLAPLPAGPRFLYAEDIARLRGVSARQARRWLASLQEMHGHDMVGSVPGRRGARRFTTEAALASIAPRSHRVEDQMRRVIEEILQRLAAVERSP